MTPPDYTAKARELLRDLSGTHCVDSGCTECVTVDREHAASDIAAALRAAHERGAAEERERRKGCHPLCVLTPAHEGGCDAGS